MKYFKAVIGAAVLVILDQYTKLLAVRHLMNKEAIPLISDVFELKYLENRGAAFGVFQDARIMFLVMTVIVLFILVWAFIKIPSTKRYAPLYWTMVLLGAGAIGNCIDRVAKGYVVDFFYFKLINFPIFNVADIYVTCSVAALFVLILFKYKEQDLIVFSPKNSVKEAAKLKEKKDNEQ